MHAKAIVKIRWWERWIKAKSVVMFCFRDVLKANLKIFPGLATTFNTSFKAQRGAESHSWNFLKVFETCLFWKTQWAEIQWLIYPQHLVPHLGFIASRQDNGARSLPAQPSPSHKDGQGRFCSVSKGRILPSQVACINSRHHYRESLCRDL